MPHLVTRIKKIVSGEMVTATHGIYTYFLLQIPTHGIYIYFLLQIPTHGICILPASDSNSWHIYIHFLLQIPTHGIYIYFLLQIPTHGICILPASDSSQEDWSLYILRLKYNFDANDITNASKMNSIITNCMWPSNFTQIRQLAHCCPDWKLFITLTL